MPLDADEYFLEPRAVRRAFDAASATYASAAAVQQEIRLRLLERLDIVRLQPTVVLDIGAGLGQATRALKDRYPRAQVVALDSSPRMLQAASRQQGFLRRFQRAAADAHRLPIRESSTELVFSNLLLEWCADPDRAFAEVRRVLREGGLFTFTTLGPDTLRELREAWRTVDDRPHVHRFIDMHDLGDALVRARFAEPVMDVERLTVTYPDCRTLHRELRLSGSGNVAAGRRRSLTGPTRWRRYEQAVAMHGREGRLPVTVEVVYGHAWAGPLITREAPDEVRIPLEQLSKRRRS